MPDLTPDQRLCMDVWKDSREMSLYLYRKGAALDDYKDARLPLIIWNTVSSIALRNAPVNLKLFFNSVIEHDVDPLTLAPVCEHASSVMRAAQIVQGLGLSSARRIAEAWMSIPLHSRSNGKFIYDDQKVVQAQLLGLVGRPSPVIATEMPHEFPHFIETIHYAGLTPYPGPYWVSARTPVGSTVVAFDNMHQGNLYGSVAISDGPVRFHQAIGERARRAEAAIEFLISALPQVINDRNALELSEWMPDGHALLELSSYLENLKNEVRRQASR